MARRQCAISSAVPPRPAQHGSLPRLCVAVGRGVATARPKATFRTQTEAIRGKRHTGSTQGGLWPNNNVHWLIASPEPIAVYGDRLLADHARFLPSPSRCVFRIWQAARRNGRPGLPIGTRSGCRNLRTDEPVSFWRDYAHVVDCQPDMVVQVRLGACRLRRASRLCRFVASPFCASHAPPGSRGANTTQ